MDNWERLALLALEEYGLKDSQLSFIRHNENITCKVVDKYTDASYVLRVHKPIEGFSLSTAQHRVEDLFFELNFIDEINNHTDLVVQKPIKNRKGNFVSRITNNNETIHATLLSWIDGKMMHHEDENYEEEAYLTGVMTAKLHQFSYKWCENKEITRLRYDQEKVKKTIRQIKEAVDLKLVLPSQYKIIQEGGNKIIALMDELDRLPHTKGIIHADLQKSNLIYHTNQVSPIDFGLCGYGYFYMDLGGVVADFGKQPVIQAFLKGYRSIIDFPDEDKKYIEAFFIYCILLAMATFVHSPKMKEWYIRRTQPICDEFILPLINNKRFIDSL